MDQWQVGRNDEIPQAWDLHGPAVAAFGHSNKCKAGTACAFPAQKFETVRYHCWSKQHMIVLLELIIKIETSLPRHLTGKENAGKHEALPPGQRCEVSCACGVSGVNSRIFAPPFAFFKSQYSC